MGNPYLIEGAIAVVTGAAQGLGLSITEQLARNGATVVMADLQTRKVEVEAGNLKQKGLEVFSSYLDVGLSLIHI